MRFSSAAAPAWKVLLFSLFTIAFVGAATPQGHASAGGQNALRITERDFHISPVKRTVSRGEVRFEVKNAGPESHELIVVRRQGRLPLRADGLTVDEETLESVKVGGLEPAQSGKTRELQLHLAPGHYQLFCNMSGHYLGGMHAELIVR